MQRMTYKITNWPEYNAALTQRGDFTIWLPKDLEDDWLEKSTSQNRGKPTIYSAQALLVCQVLRHLLKLPYRQTHGFLVGLMNLMKLSLPVPSFGYICRKAMSIGLSDPSKFKSNEIAIDSTGLKISGEGEWKVRGYGPSRRRAWLKLHISVDCNTKEIVASVVTDGHTHDSNVFGQLIPEGCQTAYADGAYDTANCHQQAQSADARAVIPPRSNARLGSQLIPEGESARDELILLQELMGEDWSSSLDYGQRNHSECAFSRIKRVFSGNLFSKERERQIMELTTKISLLNCFTRMGMPKSVPVKNSRLKSQGLCHKSSSF